jgi:diguanylate cyclase (GGDEF)-like protein
MFKERLVQEVARASRKGDIVAVMMLDLDGFKAVNDNWGHEAGDAALCEVAHRLKDICRESDVVSRLGGDEFTLLLTDITNPRDAGLFAERVIHTLAAPITVEGEHFPLTPSIGISIFPLLGMNPVELMKQADKAMYLAKSQGRNRYRVYSEQECATR